MPQPTTDRPDGSFTESDRLALLGAPVTTITGPNGDTQRFVDARTYLSVLDERDQFRRVLAAINAWRVTPVRSEADLTRLLALVGEDDESGEATRQIIAEFMPSLLSSASGA